MADDFVPEELPALDTPVTPAEFAGALVRAWGSLGFDPPSRESILVLLSQSALETGRWKSMKCFNAGNVKSVPGDGRCWSHFACNEILPFDVAARLAAGARPRTDGRAGPDAVVTSTTTGGGAVVWFYPSNPGCRFRAFHSLDEGAVDYLGLLYRRFSRAWPAVVAGDPAAFAHLLRAQGYYTASEADYARGLGQLFAEFSGLDFDVPRAVDAARALALTTMTYQELSTELVEDAVRRADEPDPTE